MQLEKKYYTVQDSETLKLMFQHIEESDILAVDTETTVLILVRIKLSAGLYQEMKVLVFIYLLLYGTSRKVL